MIVVDTSIWIAALRSGSGARARVLQDAAFARMEQLDLVHCHAAPE